MSISLMQTLPKIDLKSHVFCLTRTVVIHFWVENYDYLALHGNRKLGLNSWPLEAHALHPLSLSLFSQNHSHVAPPNIIRHLTW